VEFQSIQVMTNPKAREWEHQLHHCLDRSGLKICYRSIGNDLESPSMILQRRRASIWKDRQIYTREPESQTRRW
jgi:hypothetical protein